MKWGTRPRPFDIWHKPKSSVKGQVLTDFILEITPIERGHGGVYNVVAQPWRVFVDSASNARGAGIGILIVSREGIKLEHSLRLGF